MSVPLTAGSRPQFCVPVSEERSRGFGSLVERRMTPCRVWGLGGGQNPRGHAEGPTRLAVAVLNGVGRVSF